MYRIAKNTRSDSVFGGLCNDFFVCFIKQFFKTTKMVFVGSGRDWHPYGNCSRTSQYFSGLSWDFELLYWMVEFEVSVGSQSDFRGYYRFRYFSIFSDFNDFIFFTLLVSDKNRENADFAYGKCSLLDGRVIAEPI